MSNGFEQDFEEWKKTTGANYPHTTFNISNFYDFLQGKQLLKVQEYRKHLQCWSNHLARDKKCECDYSFKYIKSGLNDIFYEEWLLDEVFGVKKVKK